MALLSCTTSSSREHVEGVFLHSTRLRRQFHQSDRPYDRVEGLEYHSLVDEPFVAALSKDHPLARRKNIEAAELDGTPYVVYPRIPQSHYAEDVFAVLRAAGASPVAAHRAEEIHIALGMVASGLGFCLVGRSVAATSRSDIAFVPLQNVKATASIVAVTKGPPTAKVTQAFLDALAAGIWARA